jgi:hypothetical protein
MSFWGAICIVLGVAGLVISVFIWRSKGAVRGIRAIAWSLIPLAAYLTGGSTLLSRIASAVARFAGSFVFSPKSWLGVIFLGVAALLFLVSGGLPLMKWKKRRATGKSGAAAVGADGRTPVTAPAAAAAKGKRGAAAQSDSDLGDVEEILRRRGIK